MIYTGATSDEVWPLVRDFHYSRRMPSNIQHCYVARESGGLFGDTGQLQAAIIFSVPPIQWSEQVLELSRLVRSPTHNEPLTRLIAFACAWLKKNGADLLVSFADWTHDHHGGIYQAASWCFGGKRKPRIDGVFWNGKFINQRQCQHIFSTSLSTIGVIERERERIGGELVPHFDAGKFLYWRALNKSGKQKAARLGLEHLPYPKPLKQAIAT